ncbi:hypothetical protein ABLI39_10955 [Pseudarthrobacter sp. B907]|uniref:hypothetical protein n=1 Tax=Pseudarthrobacter sp. B907 TaxID=3158261 RepID=UPI0032DAB3C2
MNHKLRVLVRVDVDPGQVTLEVTGCLSQANYPDLLHMMRRANRLAAGADVIIDLHGASHLDPEILLYLRQLAATTDPASGPAAPGAAVAAAAATEGFRLILQEPAELPICLLHVGTDGEVLADLDGEITGSVHGRVNAGIEAPVDPAAAPAPDGPDLIDGLELSDYFEGTMDPAATVQALSDAALGQLADALYRHLDTPRPSFGAHTWYELAADELQQRYQGADDGAAPDIADLTGSGPAIATDRATDGPSGGELAAGPALA